MINFLRDTADLKRQDADRPLSQAASQSTRLGFKGEAEILSRRRVWSTESNALDKSKATTAVRVGGLFWLKPIMAWLMMGRRAVVVDLKGAKPCWEKALGREVTRRG